MRRIEPGPGQESVWDYPRPPKVELCTKHILIVWAGVTIVDTYKSQRVLETSHPPVYYIAPEDIQMNYLELTGQQSYCEWKGVAYYYNLRTEKAQKTQKAAWSYPEPTPNFALIKDYIAFYPALMDGCYVDGEKAQPQPGNFYGGWVTSDLVGPFKGEAGTYRW